MYRELLDEAGESKKLKKRLDDASVIIIDLKK